jgi:hypothetical protein
MMGKAVGAKYIFACMRKMNETAYLTNNLVGVEPVRRSEMEWW